MQDVLIKDINKKIAELESLILKKDDEIDNLKKQLAGRELVQYDRYGFRFTKKVIYYISQGIEEDRAIAIAWDDFPNLTMNEAFMIWRTARPVKSGLKLYARAYCVHKMKQAGFKQYEIALTLGISTATVARLMKCNILL